MANDMMQTNDNKPTNKYNYDSSNRKKEDDAYMLFLLTPNARIIKELVDEILDRLEYEGSIIFHEYPDKNELLNIMEQIYSSPRFPGNAPSTSPNNTSNNTSNEVSSMQMHNLVPSLRDLAETIFIYEMINRRRRYFNIVNNI